MNGNLDPLLALSDDLAILDGIAHRWRLCYLAQPEGNKIGVREVSALDRAIDALRNTRPANAREGGFEELVAEIQRAVNEIVPPETMTETRQEYWKAGARAAIRAVSAVLVKHRTPAPGSDGGL